MAGPSAPPPVPPWEAAQRLRLIVRQTREYFQNLTAPTSGEGIRIATFIRSPYRNDQALWKERVDNRVQYLRTAIIGRRAAEAGSHLNTLLSDLGKERERCERSWQYLTESFGGNEESRISANSSPIDTASVKYLRKQLDQINDLVQSLPTTEHLPVTKQDRIIRGIVAILRTHEVPGINAVEPNGHTKEPVDGTPEKVPAEVGDTPVGDETTTLPGPAPIPAGIGFSAVTASSGGTSSSGTF